MMTEIIGNLQDISISVVNSRYRVEDSGVYLIDNSDLFEIIATPNLCKQIRYFSNRVGDSAIYEYRTRTNNTWTRWFRVYENIYEREARPDNRGAANLHDVDLIIDRANNERRYNDTNLRNHINNYVEDHELRFKLSRVHSNALNLNNHITFNGALRIAGNIHFFNETGRWNEELGMYVGMMHRFFFFHVGHQGRIELGSYDINKIYFLSARDDTLVLHRVGIDGEQFQGGNVILTNTEYDWKTFWDFGYDINGCGVPVEPINAGFRPGDSDREIQVVQSAGIGPHWLTGKNIWFNVHGPDFTMVSTITFTAGWDIHNYEPGHNARYANRELRRNYSYHSGYQGARWLRVYYR